MKETSDSLYRTLRLGAIFALKVSEKLESWSKQTREGAGEFFSQVMRPEERERFSLERYSASAWQPEGRSLPAWEEAWFVRDLPSPPANILLAGCGSGRELLPLVDRGYRVTAFDGAPQPANISRRLAGTRAQVYEATFLHLVQASLGQPSPLLELRTQKFDAVILGWGALTHAAGQSSRRHVLKACAKFTEGPVLASFYVEKKPPPETTPQRFGRWLARTFRGLESGPARIELSGWGGFAEYLSREEIAGHAAALGRNVDWYEGDGAIFPYVTFRRHP